MKNDSESPRHQGLKVQSDADLTALVVERAFCGKGGLCGVKVYSTSKESQESQHGYSRGYDGKNGAESED